VEIGGKHTLPDRISKRLISTHESLTTITTVKRFLKLETIRLVVVMSAVNLWKLREALLRARVTAPGRKWLFEIFVENHSRLAHPGEDLIDLSTRINKISAA
jgi:hypothetical protein